MIIHPEYRKRGSAMEIYEKIFERLKELKMSQSDLSRQTGIPTSTISDWKKKKMNPQSDKLVLICKALNYSLSDLLIDGTEDTDKNNDLSVDEKYLLELFRKSNDSEKRKIIAYLHKFE